jgi:hypothetical protein
VRAFFDLTDDYIDRLMQLSACKLARPRGYDALHSSA